MAYLEYRPTQTLYQYCSLDSFLGILKSKHLWFSDLASANDPRELKLGHESFVAALKSVRHTEYHGPSGLFLSVLAGRLASYHQNAQAFCSCFSLAKDELAMWNAYGANYGGVAVGFRPTAILDSPARVQKVKYLDPNTPDDFRRLVLEIAHELDSKRTSEEYWIIATVRVFAAMTALKHTTWSYEREIRLVHVQPRKGDEAVIPTSELPDGKPIFWSKPLDRIGPLGTINYLELPYGQFRGGRFDPRKAIAEIILGPNCRITVAEATSAMRGNGFENFVVAKSECQIR